MEPLGPTGWTVKGYAFPLSLVYGFVALVCSFQLGRIVYFRHKLLGFQAMFLLFTLIWAVARAVFFQLLYGWSSNAYVVLYWAPFILQFATFSFLVLFYHATLSHSQLDNPGGLRTGVALYVAVTTLLSVVLIALIALVITSGELQYALYLVRMIESFVAAMWLLLSLALGIFGWRVSRFLRSPGARVGLANIPSGRVLAVSLLLVVIFASRVGYDAFSCVRGSAPLAVDGSGTWQMVVLGCMFFSWEILPALLVLFLFKHIPRTDAPPYYVHGVPTHAIPTDSDENAGLLGWQQAAAAAGQAAPAMSVNYGGAWPSAAHPYAHTGVHSPYPVPGQESPSGSRRQG